ncbi:MAG: non-heme iron oxygenase ferredoxin subunit [Myxococcales bacterium]
MLRLKKGQVGMVDESLVVDIAGLSPGEMKAVQHGRLSVLICNVEGEFYALENECSHAAVPLDEGTLRGCEIECDFHGALFDVRSGEALAMPATSPVRSFPVKRRGNFLTVYF